MATKQEISMIGFEIVAYAGDAQTDLIEALDCARRGEFDRAEELHASAKEALIGAHDTQTKLLSQEAGGSEMDVTFITTTPTADGNAPSGTTLLVAL